MALTLILGGLIFGGSFVLVNRGGTYLRGFMVITLVRKTQGLNLKSDHCLTFKGAHIQGGLILEGGLYSEGNYVLESRGLIFKMTYIRRELYSRFLFNFVQ